MARRRNPTQQKLRQQRADIAGICVVIVVLLGTGWYLFSRLRTEKPKPSANSIDVTWQYDGKLWQPSDTPPGCEEPLIVASPVDTSLVTSLLYPGQYRGGDYKPHGGFRFDAAKTSEITVRMPNDSRLTGMARYIEADEVQYMLAFTNPCGVMFRFDHLRTLSSRLSKIAEALPAPAVGDSRSTPTPDLPKFAMGEVIATAVGFAKSNNITMDFGMYDLRKTNEISKNAEWASKHANEAEQANYAVCWFYQLPVADADRVDALMVADDSNRTVSDYCVTPGGRTL